MAVRMSALRPPFTTSEDVSITAAVHNQEYSGLSFAI
jgi:hypothetical protein